MSSLGESLCISRGMSSGPWSLSPPPRNSKRINLWPDEILKRIPYVYMYNIIICAYILYRPPIRRTLLQSFFQYFISHIILYIPHPSPPQYTIIIILCVHVPAFMCTHARYIVIYIFIVCILLFIFRARINTLNPFKLTHYTLRAVRTLR